MIDYSCRSQRRVRRSASAEVAESRQGISSPTAMHCQREQVGQRTLCSARSGSISIRAPQQLHMAVRRGSAWASRMTCANNGPLTIANGKPRIGTLSWFAPAYGFGTRVSNVCALAQQLLLHLPLLHKGGFNARHSPFDPRPARLPQRGSARPPIRHQIAGPLTGRLSVLYLE